MMNPSEQRLTRAMLFVLATTTLGCVEYREMYVSRIEAPAQAKKGQAVDVTLINPVTPQGDANVLVQVDDGGRVVTFIVTEHEVLPGLRAHPQLVADRRLPASFIPRNTGTYHLRTRGGVATAEVAVED